MIPIILAIASYSISNAHDYEVLRFECKKVVNPSSPTDLGPTPCSYDYVVIKDSQGKEHRYKMDDVRDEAVKQMKQIEVKEK